jgi:hypothetical protein
MEARKKALEYQLMLIPPQKASLKTSAKVMILTLLLLVGGGIYLLEKHS